MRPIDADALVCSFCNVEGTAPILGLSRIIEISDVVRIIEDAPTVDVVPVRRGRWEVVKTEVKKYQLWHCRCDACKWTTSIFEANGFNFCPNCGADMREVARDG